jgi:2-oxo-3-hexenedioate decarboxylase/2-keto-4-pentenoate hydratase
VRAATEAVAVALEIVDSRIADWRLTLPDTVADNASSGAVVLGDWVPYGTDLDLANAQASLWLNGTEVDSGAGSAVMGDPAVAVAWLANALAPFGTEIRSGEFVMSGSFTTAAFVGPGDEATTTIGGLGSVSLSFT